MIQINLLKQPVKRKRAKTKRSPALLVFVSVLLMLALLGGAGWWVVTTYKLLEHTELPTHIAKDDYSPSTHTKTQAIEEVVRDIDDNRDKLQQRGILKIPYEQLSFIDQVNFEIHFAKNICDLLSRSAMQGVNFSSFHAFAFQNFNGSGLGTSREAVGQFFNVLKNEQIELKPKPLTRIFQTEEGYAFTIVSITHFNLDLESPFLLDPETIMEYGDLEFTIKRMRDVAEESGVRITGGPVKKDAIVTGEYRRLQYHISAVSSYQKVVSFVNNLYSSRIPCAFETLKLTAVNNSSVTVEADFLFTTKK